MNQKFALGSRGARLGGYLIDGLLMYGAQVGGMFLGGVVAVLMLQAQLPEGVPVSSATDQAVARGMLLGWVFWGVAAWILNFGVLQGMTGATVGKRLLGLRVVRLDGSTLGVWRSMGRSLAYAVSAIPLYLGFASIFWSERSQCWHDAICGTLVVHKDAHRVAEPGTADHGTAHARSESHESPTSRAA